MHILGILTQVVEELNPKSINLRFIRFMSPEHRVYILLPSNLNLN